MKIVAKYLGRVNEYNEPPALSYVTLKNVDTGESVDMDAVSQFLKDKGITKTDCEFEVLIAETDSGQTVGNITKLEPRKLSEEELKAISNEVDAKLPPGESPCYDI